MSKFITIIVCIIFTLLKRPQETWEVGIYDEPQRGNLLELIGNYADLEASSIPGIYEYQSAYAYVSWLNWSEQEEPQTVLNNLGEAPSNLIPGNYAYIRNSRLNDGDEANIVNENDEEVSNPIPGSYVYIEQEDGYYSADELSLPSDSEWEHDEYSEEVDGYESEEEDDNEDDYYDSSWSEEDDRDSWAGLPSDWNEQDNESRPILNDNEASHNQYIERVRVFQRDEPHFVTEEPEDDGYYSADSLSSDSIDCSGNIDELILNNVDESSSSDDEDDRDSWDGLPSDGGW